MRGRHHTDWANHIRNLEREDRAAFVREAENVESLRDHPGWGFFAALVESRVQAIEDRFLNDGGEPLSQAQYARKAGEIVGLRSVLDIPETVRGKAEQARKRQDDAAKLAVIGG